jgi:hypothetical protein
MGSEKYLRMPSMIGRNKRAMFGYLRDMVLRKIRQWYGKHLSKARHKVLIKSLTQAIPTYCMSKFLLPTTLGEEIQKMINLFWWGSNRKQGKGINRLNWDKLTTRKECEGMCFKHFFFFNLVVLGKQGWKLLTNQDAIVARIYKVKYFPKTKFLGARLGHNPSYTWLGIFASHVLVRGGQRWIIGNGKSVAI